MSNFKTFTTPRNDIIFKALFANEKDKQPLMSLLSGILGMPMDNFQNLEILNNEINSENIRFKQSRLDLRIRLRDLTEIDVELQVLDHEAYKERVLYYWSKLYSGSLQQGNAYRKLKKCILINIVYFELFTSPRMHTKFQILETEEYNKFTDHLEIHVLELDKLNAYNRSIENELLIDWAEFLSLRNEDDLMKLSERTDLPLVIQKAIRELEELQNDPNLQHEALNKELFVLDMVQRFDDAMERGLAEGMEKGIKQGVKQGIEQGKDENKIEIAKKMKLGGIDPSVIQSFTGLDIEVINSL
ncbi:MAG: Rpn family recombination-promoting nuclease/putative transposase [Bacillota bacterium]|nr:Rpn family recombination-promoting nuclease/putative transposase [Bacillota bacterium]